MWRHYWGYAVRWGTLLMMGIQQGSMMTPLLLTQTHCLCYLLASGLHWALSVWLHYSPSSISSFYFGTRFWSAFLWDLKHVQSLSVVFWSNIYCSGILSLTLGFDILYKSAAFSSAQNHIQLQRQNQKKVSLDTPKLSIKSEIGLEVDYSYNDTKWEGRSITKSLHGDRLQKMDIDSAAKIT